MLPLDWTKALTDQAKTKYLLRRQRMKSVDSV